MSTVGHLHRVLDARLAETCEEVARDKMFVSCRSGCSACCSEPLYVERREAQFLVDTIPVENRDTLARRVQQWWDAFFAAGLHSNKPDDRDGDYTALLKFRAARLACPLLRDDQLCASYDARPISCRTHIALKSRRLCDDDAQRPFQKFLLIDPISHVRLVLALTGEPVAMIEFDHLGIWLGHILLGKTERSAAARSQMMDVARVRAALGAAEPR